MFISALCYTVYVYKMQSLSDPPSKTLHYALHAIYLFVCPVPATTQVQEVLVSSKMTCSLPTSKFFYHWKEKEISNKTYVSFPTTP